MRLEAPGFSKMKKSKTEGRLSSGDYKVGNVPKASAERKKSSVKVAPNSKTKIPDIKNITNLSNSGNIKNKPRPSNLILDSAIMSQTSGKGKSVSPSILNESNSPSQLHGTFWNQVLATTPPTGRKSVTPSVPSSTFTFFPSDAPPTGTSGVGNKRRNSLPAKLHEKPIVKISPQLDHLFEQFLATQENWERCLEDLAEVELGRGPTRLRGLLQKEKSHQIQNPNQTQQLDSATSSLSPPTPVTEDNNGTANLNVDVAYAPKPHKKGPPPVVVVAVPTPSHSELPEVSTHVRKSGTPVPSSLNNKLIKDKPRLLAKHVPRFFWPEGKPTSNAFVQQSLSKAEDKLKTENNSVNYQQFGELISASGIPLYWKKPFWMALGLLADGICTSKIFLPFLRYLLTECPDESARFGRILSSASRNFPGGYDKNNYNNNNITLNAKYYNNHGDYCEDLKFIELPMSDFVPMIQDIIDTHPGLGFLRDAPEFHSRYITTVISRIFYKVNRSWSGRLTLTEMRRSNLHRVIKRLEEETDINTITEYFSYEHFYVIYCKFWELDKDHDLLIDKHDLAAHADHSLSSRIIDRIFSGTVLRGWDVANPTRASTDKMTYSDFVWFLLSEEDKKTATAIEYWFRCLDLDGDGVISPYELQFFYSEQENRIESYGIEPLHFSNVYCQIVDMLHCSPTGIRLKDLKKNPHLAANVFNTVFNLEKYLEHEQRDPFAASASLGNLENAEGESDWDKYAAGEYELLISEESPGDHLHESGLDEVLTP